jgi:hypothetical protein
MLLGWREEEIEYLKILEETSMRLSRNYHKAHFALKSYQSRFRIPAIVIGSFTGVASFGTSTFPVKYHSTIAITVGIVNIIIAILNTIETFFKIGENINMTATASAQLRILSNDINKELSIDESVRETSGVNYLRDSYTRYQQILSGAPILDQFKAYVVDSDAHHNFNKKNTEGILKHIVSYITPSASAIVSARTSIDEEKVRQRLRKVMSNIRKVDASTSTHNENYLPLSKQLHRMDTHIIEVCEDDMS